MSNDAVSEAAAAGVASACSKLATYPFDLLKAKMATAEKNETLVEAASKIVKKDGVIGLYRGSGPRVFKSATGKVLYFYIYRTLSNALLARNQNQPLSTLQNLLIGYFSEVFELPVVMPLDAIATRVQLSKESTSFAKVVKQLWDEKRLFVSWEAYVLGAMQPALQNTIFDQLKRRINRNLSALESFVLGVFAASISITLTYPLEFAKTMSQAIVKTKSTRSTSIIVMHRTSKGDLEKDTSIESMKLAEKLGLVRVTSGDILDNLKNSTCQLGDAARRELETNGSISDHVVVDFMYTMLTRYPLEEGKRGFLVDGFPKDIWTVHEKHQMLLTKMDEQSQQNRLILIDQSEKLQHVSVRKDNMNVLSILLRTVEREGLQGVFKGLSANLAQGVLSAALMLMVKEKLFLLVSQFIQRIRSLIPKVGS